LFEKKNIIKKIKKGKIKLKRLFIFVFFF